METEIDLAVIRDKVRYKNITHINRYIGNTDDIIRIITNYNSASKRKLCLGEIKIESIYHDKHTTLSLEDNLKYSFNSF